MQGKWLAILGTLLFAAILLTHGWVDEQGRSRTQPADQPGSDPSLAGLSAADREFWTRVAELQPVYEYSKMRCPVDNTELLVPVRRINAKGQLQDNRLGGVTTDLMKLALSPSAADPTAPDFASQDWRALLVTNPNNGATYIENDLVRIRMGYLAGASVNLRNWDLAHLAPRLASTPQTDWTWDERNLARYLTMRQAGENHTDLAFAALYCAYASNHSHAIGDPFRVPSAAYYALATAHIEESLVAASAQANRLQQSTALTFLAELRRLLGKFDQAEAALEAAQGFVTEIQTDLSAQATQATEGTEQAQAISKNLDYVEQAQSMLNQISQLIDGNDAELKRVVIPGYPAPPPGWYIDGLLPPINQQLAEHRSDWSTAASPQEIVERIITEYETAPEDD